MFNAFSIVREVAGVVAGATAKIPAIEKKFRISERLDGNWPEGPFLWLHGASLGASAASDAVIGHFESHDKYLHRFDGYIVSYFCQKATVFGKKQIGCLL